MIDYILEVCWLPNGCSGTTDGLVYPQNSDAELAVIHMDDFSDLLMVFFSTSALRMILINLGTENF
jgi:hypothetical protein